MAGGDRGRPARNNEEVVCVLPDKATNVDGGDPHRPLM